MRRWVISLLAAIAALSVWAPVELATAHSDGRIELFVADLTVRASGEKHDLQALLVDRDSGDPAPGFAVSITGVGPSGASLAKTELSDRGAGNYGRATDALALGSWSFTVSAEQGPSATLAIAITKNFSLEVTVAGGTTPTTVIVNPTGRKLRVKVAHDPDRQSEMIANYVPVVAIVTDADTGEAITTPLELRASARDEAGIVDSTTFHLAYPYADDQTKPPGRYVGVVIVPRGGTWNIAVSVYDRKEAANEKIPKSLADGAVTVTVEAGELGGTTKRSTTRKADVGEVIWRIVHWIIAAAWFMIAGLLLIASWPGRLGLTGNIGAWIERKTRRLGNALLWVTATMWLSGLINLWVGTAFAPPLSTKQANELFRVPYAQSYTIILYVKMAVYLVLTALTWPLIRRARRNVEQVNPDPKSGRRLTFSLTGVVLLGGFVIMVCVTLLTVLHALSERRPIVK